MSSASEFSYASRHKDPTRPMRHLEYSKQGSLRLVYLLYMQSICMMAVRCAGYDLSYSAHPPLTGRASKILSGRSLQTEFTTFGSHCQWPSWV